MRGDQGLTVRTATIKKHFFPTQPAIRPGAVLWAPARRMQRPCLLRHRVHQRPPWKEVHNGHSVFNIGSRSLRGAP